MNEPLDRLLRRDAVQAATGLSKATIYRLIASGDFPAPIKIGLRAVAWPLSSILSWIEAKKAESSQGMHAEMLLSANAVGTSSQHEDDETHHDR